MGEFTKTVFCCSNKIPEVRYATQTSLFSSQFRRSRSMVPIFDEC